MGRYEVAISELTLTEARATGGAALRDRLLALLAGFRVLPVEEGARHLAREYVSRGVFSPATAMDALHVAIAVASRQDILVSWNFRHLVNRQRRALVNEVNVLTGFPPIEILRKMIFDYTTAAHRAGIPRDKLERLAAIMRAPSSRTTRPWRNFTSSGQSSPWSAASPASTISCDRKSQADDLRRPMKRAIEEGFPILEINRLSVSERNAFKPIYQMYKWFARRALVRVPGDPARLSQARGYGYHGGVLQGPLE